MKREDFTQLASKAVYGEDGRGLVGNNKRHLLERVAKAIQSAFVIGNAIGGKSVSFSDEQAVYQDEAGRVWHPHRGYWCWKTATELNRSQEALRSAREFIESSAFNVPTKDYFDAVLKDIDGALVSFTPHPDQLSPMTVGPEDYFERPLTDRLRERAKAAREERNATSLSDALHFEQAASDLERLQLDVAFWKENSATESRARIALTEELSAAQEALRKIAKADFLDFSLAPDRSAAAIARAALNGGAA